MKLNYVSLGVSWKKKIKFLLINQNWFSWKSKKSKSKKTSAMWWKPYSKDQTNFSKKENKKKCCKKKLKLLTHSLSIQDRMALQYKRFSMNKEKWSMSTKRKLSCCKNSMAETVLHHNLQENYSKSKVKS